MSTSIEQGAFRQLLVARLSPSSQNASHERGHSEIQLYGSSERGDSRVQLHSAHWWSVQSVHGGEARESQEAVRLLAKPGGCRYSSTPARTATATENVDR